MFGSSQGSGLFGNKPGGGGLFGTTTNTGTTSLFGNKPASSSLFGSTTSTQNKPAFGSNTGSIFGGGTATNSFGTSTSGSGLFGNNQQSTSGGGLFGKSSTTTTSGSLFGSSNVPNGTGNVKFNPPITPDTMMKNGTTQNIQTKNFCITAMKEYEAKSFEELRVDDYIANRKTSTTSSTGGLFGTSTTTNATSSGGLFGNSGTQPKSLFGPSTNTSSPFGGSTAQGISLFGSNNNQQQQQQQQQQTSGGGLFGSIPAGRTTFGGSTTTTSSPFGGGGTTTGASLFGKPAGALPFGSTQNTGGLNSTKNTAPSVGGSLFGNTSSTTTNAFGATNTGSSLFGNTAAPSTGGGLFGNKPATSSFGNTNTFGQPAAGGGLFGNTTAAKPGGLFGGNTSTNTGGGLFGNTATQSSGGLFGNTGTTQQQSGGLFGSTTQQPAGNVVVQNPATVAVATQPIILGSDVNETMLKMAMIEANLASNPYGDSPLLKLASTVDTDEKPNPISAQRQLRFLKKASETSTLPKSVDGSPIVSKTNFLSMSIPVAGSKIRSRSIAVSGDLNYKSTREPPTLGKGIGGKISGSRNTSMNSSFNTSLLNKSVDGHVERALNSSSNVLPGTATKIGIKHLDFDEVKQAMSNANKSIGKSPRDNDELPQAIEVIEENENGPNDSLNVDPRDAAYRRAGDIRQPPRLDFNVTSETNTSALSSTSLCSPATMNELPAAGITLRTSDYYCEPTIRAMSDMVQNGEVILPQGLTVGRATYGNVFWPGPLKLKDIALDEVVIFRHKEVTVYPDESKKPPLGEGLNRSAEVTLERVWYVNRETKEEVKDPIALADIGWRDRLERVTLKMGATFKDYRPSTGSWVFKVEHFSKYGLLDSEEEEPPIKKPIDVREKERQIQSMVQRTFVFSDTNSDEVQTELEIEEYLSEQRTVPAGIVRPRGLGGNIDAAVDMDIDDDDVITIPPEKKLKIEVDTPNFFEDSKKLRQLLDHTFTLRREPKPPSCIPPVRQFEGGYPIKQCLGYDVSRFMDIASFHGNTARVGWSSNGLFVKSLQPENNGISVRPLDKRGDIEDEYVSDMLEHNIRNSHVIKRNHSISAKVKHHELEGQQVAPRIKPTNDFPRLIDSFCATASQSKRDNEERVWKLVKALFPGNQDGPWMWKRLDNICSWLRDELAVLPKYSASGRGFLVWRELCRGNLENAVKAAENEGLQFLCSLLSSFLVDTRATQQDFKAQLDFWKDHKMLEHIDLHILKIYLLMAGKMNIVFPSKGKEITVSCIDGLSWKQAVGLFLWYLRGFECFEKAWEDIVENVPSPTEPDDVLFFNLLQICREPSSSVEAVLDAAFEYSQSMFDAHLSWHLWTVLRSIGYNTMDPSAEQRLHTSYSEQLMANTLPHLALFVLSHISNDQARSVVMKECLDRFALRSTKADYDRILEIVNIPSSWIAGAKYIKALAINQKSLASEMAVLAGDLIPAFNLFVKEVAPNAVVSDDIPELQRLVELFEPFTTRIPAWGHQGQLYADYVDFKNFSKFDSDENDDLRIAELISSLITKLQAPVFVTPIQRLCAQNISLEMFEAKRLLTGELTFQLPFDMTNLTQELSRSLSTMLSEKH